MFKVLRTVKIHHGKIHDWHGQYAHFCRDLLKSGFVNLPTQAECEAACAQAMADFGQNSGVVRLEYGFESQTGFSLQIPQLTAHARALPTLPRKYRVFVSDFRVPNDHFGSKRADRRAYDAAWQTHVVQGGFDEAILLNERGDWAESCLHNLFWQTQTDQFCTADLALGGVQGRLRAYLLARGWQIAIFPKQNLEFIKNIWLGNSIRGLIPVGEIWREGRRVW